MSSVDGWQVRQTGQHFCAGSAFWRKRSISFRRPDGLRRLSTVLRYFGMPIARLCAGMTGRGQHKQGYRWSPRFRLWSSITIPVRRAAPGSFALVRTILESSPTLKHFIAITRGLSAANCGRHAKAICCSTGTPPVLCPFTAWLCSGKAKSPELQSALSSTTPARRVLPRARSSVLVLSSSCTFLTASGTL